MGIEKSQIDVYLSVAVSYSIVGRGLAPAASDPQEQRKNLATLHEFALERYKFATFYCRRERAPALRWYLAVHPTDRQISV